MNTQATHPDTESGQHSRQRPEFVWGVSTSAFQIEGAALQDGRGDSIWDVFCRQKGTIKDQGNGDVACDHYHRMEEDINLIASLKIPAYRFSISWPRVQPLGEGAWNEKGFDFYNRLIDRLIEKGISPHITLYHWDLPQPLQNKGGWESRETVGHFANYALEVAKRFSHKVASMTTHNEPWVVAILGHESGMFAPGVKSTKAAMQVAHHLLLSHGLTLKTLREHGIKTPLGIVLNQSPIYPATNSEADLKKAQLDDGLLIRWYMDPLIKGSYPEDILNHLGANAPDVMPGDMQNIQQPLDFLGINYYTRGIASATPLPESSNEGKEVTAMGWEVYPQGLTDLLVRLNHDYRLPPIYIMENGAAYDDQPTGNSVHDIERTQYIKRHIAAMKEAIHRGVNVGGYFVWSLMDNFEWAEGYTKRFGIVYVDYETQRRLPKDSALWYRDYITSGQV